MDPIIKFRFILLQERLSKLHKVDSKELQNSIDMFAQTQIHKGNSNLSLRFKGINPPRIDGFIQEGNVWRITAEKVQALQKKPAPKKNKKTKERRPSVLKRIRALRSSKTTRTLKEFRLFEEMPYELIETILNFCSIKEILLFSQTSRLHYAHALQADLSSYFSRRLFKTLKHGKIPDHLFKRSVINLHLDLEKQRKIYPDEDLLVTVERVSTEFSKFKSIKELTFSGFDFSTHFLKENKDKIFAERIIFETLSKHSRNLPLETLILKDVKFSDKQIEDFAKSHPHLKKICLDRCHIEDDFAIDTLLTHCGELEVVELTLRNYRITDDMLYAVALKCKQLTYFVLSPSEGPQGDVTHHGLGSIASNCHSLQLFGAIYSSQLTDHILKTLGENNRGLKYVNLCNASEITDQGVKELVKNTPHMRSMRLDLTKITDKSLRAIGKNCPNLHALFLAGCKKITHVGIGALVKQTQNLTSMQLDEIKITDKSIKALCEYCPNLQKLSLVNCSVSQEGLIMLARKLSAATIFTKYN